MTQLTQGMRRSVAGYVYPHASTQQDAILVSVDVVGLPHIPPRVNRRHGAAVAVVADEGVLGGGVGGAQEDARRLGGQRDGALVLGLGAGHGQVGAQLGAPALRFSVADRLVEQSQTAAGTAVEAVRAGDVAGSCSWKQNI